MRVSSGNRAELIVLRTPGCIAVMPDGRIGGRGSATVSRLPGGSPHNGAPTAFTSGAAAESGGGAAVPDQGGSPVNRERLATLQGAGGGSALVAELVGLFTSDVPPRLELIRSALGSEDAEGLVRTAHGLKGSASTLGADGMAELCRQMEAHGRAGDWSQAKVLHDSLVAEFERVKRALSEWLAAL
jgi:two-component system, sensor histidine kinase and response regulator